MKDTEEKMNEALIKAEMLQATVKKYELAKTSLEIMGQAKTALKRFVEYTGESGETATFEMPKLSEEKERAIFDFVKNQYTSEIDYAHATVESILSPVADSVAEIANQVKKETSASMPKDSSTGSGTKKASTGSGMKKASITTVDKITDAELDRLYFKEGLTVKQIAQKIGANTAGIYKRLEKLRYAKLEVEKECVSSK